MASPNSGKTISIDLNAGNTLLGEVTVPNTGGWQTWETVSHDVYINAGTYDFGIYAPKGGFNINWFKITEKE